MTVARATDVWLLEVMATLCVPVVGGVEASSLLPPQADRSAVTATEKTDAWNFK